MTEKTIDQTEEKLRQDFLRLRAGGKSFNEIATALNVSVDTVIYWVKQLKHELHNQKAVELDTINHKYSLTRKSRIELMGNVLNKIQAELDSRDYSDVPTEKLFDYLLKYSTELQKHYEPPVFTQMSSGIDPSLFENQISWTG